MRTGNSLAHLLCQEQERRVAHGQDHMRKVSLTGNSLAHLLCQEQKRRVALSVFASFASCADKQDERELELV